MQRRVWRARPNWNVHVSHHGVPSHGAHRRIVLLADRNGVRVRKSGDRLLPGARHLLSRSMVVPAWRLPPARQGGTERMSQRSQRRRHELREARSDMRHGWRTAVRMRRVLRRALHGQAHLGVFDASVARMPDRDPRYGTAVHHGGTDVHVRGRLLAELRAAGVSGGSVVRSGARVPELSRANELSRERTAIKKRPDSPSGSAGLFVKSMPANCARPQDTPQAPLFFIVPSP